MRKTRLDGLTTWKSPALSSDAISTPRRFARRLMLLSALAMALNGCQSLIDQSYQPSVSPSSNPQIVDEVQKNDPRAAMGAREHPRIVASYGGEYKDAKTERLVARIAGALTAVSENPSQSYRITILNSPAINAFALPGGYLYVTRGLLALANDASEVAAVLSHEMGHVTANHGIERQKREEAEVIASRVVAEVLSSDIAGKQALARGKLRLAAFSRQQELQADVIGVRMLGEAGYDPYSAARFLDSMAAYSRFMSVDPEADQSLDFLSSHPNSAQRIELARTHARAFGQEGSVGDKGRDYYLDGIDGLLYGDSPEEGYVRGQTFLNDYFFICSLRAASLAKGESGSIGFSLRGGLASKRSGCEPPRLLLRSLRSFRSPRSLRSCRSPRGWSPRGWLLRSPLGCCGRPPSRLPPSLPRL